MSEDVTFRFGLPYARDRLYLASSADEFDEEEPYSVWYTLFLDDPIRPWAHDVMPWRAAASCRFVPLHPGEDWSLVALSDEGDVHFNYGPSERTEKIPGAGLWSDDAVGWGYMQDIRQIGEHLYACGGAGQVYRRLGADRWSHMDQGLRQDVAVTERLLPLAIAGPTEDAIYLAGSMSSVGYPPKLHFWNGESWRELPLPESAARLTNMCVESATRIWLCGANGTLLLGNADDGFVDLSTPEDNQLFSSLCLYRGIVFLASNLGLYAYDPQDAAAGIRRVTTGLSPELEDTSTIASVDDTLWSIGAKDIVRYDGTAWQRIDHPDNPPIGSARSVP